MQISTAQVQLNATVPMIPEMILPSESFAAHFARIGSFVGVGSFMNHQIIRFSKVALAETTDELFFRATRLPTAGLSTDTAARFLLSAK